MKIVIKLGGSITFNKQGPDYEYISKLIPVIKEVQKKHAVTLVVGGGKFVEVYAKDAKKLGLSNEQIEWLYIDLLKANTRLFSYLLPGIKVVGGIKPGQNTDTNAALEAAKQQSSLLIKLTDTNGLYDKDPDFHKDAKFLNKISYKDIDKIVQKKTGPKNYGILSPSAARIIEKNKIRVVVVGKDQNNILKILAGKKIGTEISE
ncbi:MAG: hypothetical protein ABIG30_00490 [Candidatus Aenigmatarchaeota archaeon]